MSLTFSIGALLNKPVGSQEKFLIDEPVSLGGLDAPHLRSNVTASVRFLKLPHEISVQLKDVRTSVNARCSRCLKSFEFSLFVPSAEREFVVDLPERDIDPGEGVFFADRVRSRIDLKDMVKEELLLHFSSVPVCFDGCKGLCDMCGIDLNAKTCSCKHESASRISPFKFIHK